MLHGYDLSARFEPVVGSYITIVSTRPMKTAISVSIMAPLYRNVVAKLDLALFILIHKIFKWDHRSKLFLSHA
jgi:hypothetical protein